MFLYNFNLIGTPLLSIAISISQDIACGMSYLHSLDLLHRDLKRLFCFQLCMLNLLSDNILVTADYRAKIIDFGRYFGTYYVCFTT